MTQNSLPDSKEESVRSALSEVRCCYPESVTELGLIKSISMNHGVARVQVLPCCLFGLTRLVASIQHGVAPIDGVERVEVDVAWDQIGTANQSPRSTLVQVNLQAWAAAHGIKPGSIKT
jgi:metal-sulfur cluster biosynthetic enzyme